MSQSGRSSRANSAEGGTGKAIRDLAHTLLNKHECEILKAALRHFRATKSVPYLCTSLSQVVNTSQKTSLLLEIRWMLPDDLKPEFDKFCQGIIDKYPDSDKNSGLDNKNTYNKRDHTRRQSKTKGQSSHFIFPDVAPPEAESDRGIRSVTPLSNLTCRTEDINEYCEKRCDMNYEQEFDQEIHPNNDHDSSSTDLGEVYGLNPVNERSSSEKKTAAKITTVAVMEPQHPADRHNENSTPVVSSEYDIPERDVPKQNGQVDNTHNHTDPQYNDHQHSRRSDGKESPKKARRSKPAKPKSSGHSKGDSVPSANKSRTRSRIDRPNDMSLEEQVSRDVTKSASNMQTVNSGSQQSIHADQSTQTKFLRGASLPPNLQLPNDIRAGQNKTKAAPLRSSSSVTINTQAGKLVEIRKVKLTRTSGQSLGFSIRGGKDVNSGVFVSDVSKNGQADHQGLLVGDRILKVNDVSFRAVSHEEAVHVVKRYMRLVLYVTSPLKDGCGESENGDPMSKRVTAAGKLVQVQADSDGWLGCSIKGGTDYGMQPMISSLDPESPAHKAGLKTGDLILRMNGVDITSLTHAQIVSLATSSRSLKLHIKPFELPERQDEARDGVYGAGRASQDTTPTPTYPPDKPYITGPNSPNQHISTPSPEKPHSHKPIRDDSEERTPKTKRAKQQKPELDKKEKQHKKKRSKNKENSNLEEKDKRIDKKDFNESSKMNDSSPKLGAETARRRSQILDTKFTKNVSADSEILDPLSKTEERAARNSEPASQEKEVVQNDGQILQQINDHFHDEDEWGLTRDHGDDTDISEKELQEMELAHAEVILPPVAKTSKFTPAPQVSISPPVQSPVSPESASKSLPSRHSEPRKASVSSERETGVRKASVANEKEIGIRKASLSNEKETMSHTQTETNRRTEHRPVSSEKDIQLALESPNRNNKYELPASPVRSPTPPPQLSRRSSVDYRDTSESRNDQSLPREEVRYSPSRMSAHEIHDELSQSTHVKDKRRQSRNYDDSSERCQNISSRDTEFIHHERSEQVRRHQVIETQTERIASVVDDERETSCSRKRRGSVSSQTTASTTISTQTESDFLQPNRAQPDDWYGERPLIARERPMRSLYGGTMPPSLDVYELVRVRDDDPRYYYSQDMQRQCRPDRVYLNRAESDLLLSRRGLPQHYDVPRSKTSMSVGTRLHDDTVGASDGTDHDPLSYPNSPRHGSYNNNNNSNRPVYLVRDRPPPRRDYYSLSNLPAQLLDDDDPYWPARPLHRSMKDLVSERDHPDYMMPEQDPRFRDAPMYWPSDERFGLPYSDIDDGRYMPMNRDPMRRQYNEYADYMDDYGYDRYPPAMPPPHWYQRWYRHPPTQEHMMYPNSPAHMPRREVPERSPMRQPYMPGRSASFAQSRPEHDHIDRTDRMRQVIPDADLSNSNAPSSTANSDRPKRPATSTDFTNTSSTETTQPRETNPRQGIDSDRVKYLSRSVDQGLNQSAMYTTNSTPRKTRPMSGYLPKMNSMDDTDPLSVQSDKPGLLNPDIGRIRALGSRGTSPSVTESESYNIRERIGVDSMADRFTPDPRFADALHPELQHYGSRENLMQSRYIDIDAELDRQSEPPARSGARLGYEAYSRNNPEQPMPPYYNRLHSSQSLPRGLASDYGRYYEPEHSFPMRSESNFDNSSRMRQYYGYGHEYPDSIPRDTQDTRQFVQKPVDDLRNASNRRIENEVLVETSPDADRTPIAPVAPRPLEMGSQSTKVDEMVSDDTRDPSQRVEVETGGSDEEWDVDC